jgi:DNA-binding transcriptional MerR regulator
LSSVDQPETARGPGYSIRVASRLTGISPDKLRIWERRYGFPRPARTDSGVRTYSEPEIERLVLVSRAIEAGYRASEAIAKTPEELRAFLAASVRPLTVRAAAPLSVDGFLRSLRADEPTALRNELRQAVATLGAKRFVTDIASPLVERVGEAWHAGLIAVRHEHLFSQTLSTQIRLLLSAYEEPARDGPVVLLTTLPDERHGLGLEMAALYLAVDGALIRMMGVDTPTDQTVEAALALGADVVGLSLSGAADMDTCRSQVSNILAALPPHVEVWLGGLRAGKLALEHERLRYTVTWADLDAALAAWQARRRQAR